jgi:predicted Zn-dependent protease with MMP-like domain
VSSSLELEIGAWVAFFALVIGLFFWIKRDSEAFLRKGVSTSSTDPVHSEPASPIDPAWQHMTDRADAVVQTAIAELPDDVRAEAQSVPVLFEERSANDKPGRIILGIYRGFEANHISARKGPIVLYLRSIEAFTGSTAAGFDEQVRKTFLHELGHHLGWGEVDVRARGL